ncbi:unnamed protein product [Gongylonema pulchrum]|uniref:Fibronectin type-III domain-containing protein n=1 Tax=Gongylonema pulchrum TaxID=637853 RepID=A0A183ELD5_9BILA|nr:unnamed protein product [Gongylonema pulchrum]
MMNNSLEFICMLPETVFCVNHLLSDGGYQLRVVYASTNNATEFTLPMVVEKRNLITNLLTVCCVESVTKTCKNL